MVDIKETYEYTKDLTVLYVEDNESVRDASVSIFSEFFSEVDSANDGEDGLIKYNKHKEESGSYYDLVITDLNMPKMCGTDLVAAIHEINFEQSIVVVSAHNESHRLIELIDYGIAHFIQKPIKPNQFINVAYKVCKNIVARKMLNQKHELVVEQNIDLERIIEERTKELHQKNEALEHQLYFENLTGLPNRNSLLRDLNQDNASVLLININHFKHFNDIYGLSNGDLLLKNFAELLQKILPTNCKLYKLSADEFVILGDSNSIQEYSTDTIKDILQKIREYVFHFRYKDEDIESTISVTMGISYEESNALKKASLAFTHAKKHRYDYFVYDDKLKLIEAGENNFNAIKAIQSAIREDKVIPYFQLIQNKNGDKKYEVLMRISYNDIILTPAHFLSISKKSGDYRQLTRIIIEKSFKFFENRDERFSVNLTYDDIADKELIDYLHIKIQEYKMQNRVIFEIVESENIEDFEIVKSFMRKMQSIGIQIAIDDFGSGYTNYSYMLQLKPDFLKIDGSIIKDIDKNSDSYLITQSIVDFAAKLGIETVAEYIHSKDVYDLAKDLNIDNFQGFYLDAPSDSIN